MTLHNLNMGYFWVDYLCFMNFESKSQYLQVAKWREKIESAVLPRDLSISQELIFLLKPKKCTQHKLNNLNLLL